ncbi:uncharacterized protein UV8b_06183 [Ustilaginoidea virens]|uniref:Uncharacterized protein n=1 Tax=Ustilaginoidea virens TaxID=1159556 RepID=A0A063CCY9_USTVR|nr:uncharacterized protein UV8b_06183 [Ustilaginoidea virens]QUC21942.1 hypothetical protein UV8b_06183 [Ustilaginoidea virens]GAO16552.1 hypothetical protein UVI_02023660 [Ustilaginoidea virens]
MEDAHLLCLEDYFISSPGPLRPLMVSLNGHNSWLLSFPRPWADQKQTGRAYFHIVLDPWLVGPTELVGSWFIRVDLPVAAAMPTADAVEAAARQIEDLASEYVLSRRLSNEVFNPASHIDAILLGFHYYDHVHEATLREFGRKVPVLATREAASIVKPWNHFSYITIVGDLGPAATSWRAPELHPGPPLPSWLTVLRLAGHREINFCLAMVWTHWESPGVEVHEAILSTPHGTLLDQGPLQAFLDAEPKTRKLAMLHGLKESHVGGKQTSFGAKGGLQLYRKLGGVDYWVLSNHSMLNYTGIFMRLSRAADTARTLEWALDQELVEKKAMNKPSVFRVPNGGFLVLDA